MKRQLSVLALVALCTLGSMAMRQFSVRTETIQKPRSEQFKTYDDFVEALIDWKIQEHDAVRTLASTSVAQRSGLPPSFEAYIAKNKQGCEHSIKTAISGDYEGWEDGKIYELDNGQLWKQSSYHYHYHYAYHPSVLIYPSDVGCTMKVDGDDDDGANVVRLK